MYIMTLNQKNAPPPKKIKKIKFQLFASDVLHAMKAMLSYHHACKQTKTPLVDTDYLLAVPVLVNAATLGSDRRRGDHGTLSAPQYDHLVSREGLGSLVEQFTTFMATRPTYMKESYNQVSLKPSHSDRILLLHDAVTSSSRTSIRGGPKVRAPARQ